MLKNIFKTKLAFAPIDPLGAGLREMIEEARRQPTAFSLYDDDFDGDAFWSKVEEDLSRGGEIDFH